MIARSDSGDLNNREALGLVLMGFWTTIYDKEDNAYQNTSNIIFPCNVDSKKMSILPRLDIMDYNIHYVLIVNE